MDYVNFCRDLAARLGPTTTEEDVFFCFRLLLGREPNAVEVPGHMQQIGQELPQLVRQYLNSHEFSVRNLLEVPEAGYALARMDGYELYVDPEDDAVGRHAMRGSYEDHVAAAFRRHIKPGDTVVDIGANVGFFTALAAHLVGDRGRVISIEPNARNCRYIEATKRRNGWVWQTTHCVAASERVGLLTLFSAYSNGSVAEPTNTLAALMRSTIVQGVALDGFLDLDRLDFIKIDVEGHEPAALSGFGRHLERFKPVIVSEFTPGSMQAPKAFLEMLYGLDYQLSVIANEHDVIACGQDANALMELWRRTGVDHVDILATQVA